MTAEKGIRPKLKKKAGTEMGLIRQEIIDAGLECSFSSLKTSLLYYSIGGEERLLEALTGGYFGEAKARTNTSDQWGAWITPCFLYPLGG